MFSSTGLFPELGPKIVESLGAGSLSDVAETHLFTIFLNIFCTWKTSDAKWHVLWIYINIPSTMVVLIVLARTFEIYFEKANKFNASACTYVKNY